MCEFKIKKNKIMYDTAFTGVFSKGNKLIIRYPMYSEDLSFSFYANKKPFVLSDSLFSITLKKEDYKGGIAAVTIELNGCDVLPYAYVLSKGDMPVADPYTKELTEEGSEYFNRIVPLKCHKSQGSTIKVKDLVTYCIHVKGFTASCEALQEKAGTFEGIIQKLDYLKKLSVNCIELMPAYEFKSQEDEPGVRTIDFAMKHCFDTERKETKSVNYWGYKPGFYMAPKAAYAGGESASESFMKLSNALHKARMKLVMQLYFPESVPISYIREVLHFYVLYYGVDGFHIYGNSNVPELFAGDAILQNTILILNDFSKERYYSLTGKDPLLKERIAILNLEDRNTLRRVLKSDAGSLQDYIAFCRTPVIDYPRSVYITSHDGFTMHDLVTYNRKHNEANGELNRDGEDYNCSWNCGEEGETEDMHVNYLRMKQIHNIQKMLLMNRGMLYLMMGDEVRRSQKGNNNPYCQDNAISYFDWNFGKIQSDTLKEFIRLMKLRTSLKLWNADEDYALFNAIDKTNPDLSFHSKRSFCIGSGDEYSIGMLYSDAGNTVLVAYNFGWKSAQISLPSLIKAGHFRFAGGIHRDGAMMKDQTLVLRPRSSCILIYD